MANSNSSVTRCFRGCRQMFSARRGILHQQLTIQRKRDEKEVEKATRWTQMSQMCKQLFVLFTAVDEGFDVNKQQKTSHMAKNRCELLWRRPPLCNGRISCVIHSVTKAAFASERASILVISSLAAMLCRGTKASRCVRLVLVR